MRAAFFTFGCKVNQYETQCLMGDFSAAGFEICASEEVWTWPCEVYVVNSCTVTAEGDSKVRKLLRRLRREHPTALLALCGCYAQAFENIAQLVLEADVITGSSNRNALLPGVQQALATGERVIQVEPHRPGETYEPLAVRRFIGRTRAFVKIQDGCERYCAYCIIPKARGPFRSKPLALLREELLGLAQQGFTEVVLAGINLSCYGIETGHTLYDAVKLACETQGLGRVRLSSLEPELLDAKTIHLLAAQNKFCPQFHLSLQSGSDTTLQRMNRHYTAAQYSEIVANIRSAFENPAITTDIMVGFPGETDQHFEESLAFCETLGLAKAHVFAYSRRPGTTADRMPRQIDAAEKSVRAHRMRTHMAASRVRFLEGQAGTLAQVLFERESAPGVWSGYSQNYTPVRAASGRALGNEVLTVRIHTVSEDACIGEIQL